MATTTPSEIPISQGPTSNIPPTKIAGSEVDAAARQRVLRKVLLGIAAVVALGLVAHLVLILWSQHEFTPVESLVIVHSSMLAHGRGLYYDLNHYPFTVSPYGPIFYTVSGYLHKWGLPPYLSGRLPSVAALLTALWLVWKALGYLTQDAYARASGAILAASTSNILFWGTVGQTDMLACCFSFAAFTMFLRYRERHQIASLVWSGVLVILAIFTKQTAIAAGAAIGLTLLVEDRKRAVAWISAVGLTGGAIVLVLNAVTHGAYIADAVFANMNPLAWFKLQQHAQYLILTGAGVILTAALGLWNASRKTAPVYIYAGMAIAIWLLTAPKIGSDLNYQIELMLALSLCAGCALAELEFFPSLIASRKTWVTLLQMPLLLHVAVNVLLTARVVAERVLLEPYRRQETAALKPFVDRPGHLLSPHFESLALYRGHIEVEPFIYSLMVQAGRTDPGPLLADLSARRFDTVILGENLFEPPPKYVDPELSHLPYSQLDAIRRNYHIVRNIEGPYGLYVYEPNRD